MPQRPALPKSELEVARIVWRLGEATVREVEEQLPKKRGLDFKTVQNYLRRLEAKGYLRTKWRGRAKVYKSRVRPRQVMREMVDDFVERLFDGEAMPLLQHVVRDRGLSNEEIEQLRQMLNQLEAEKDESVTE
jgi:predicted transcriptional regulator